MSIARLHPEKAKSLAESFPQGTDWHMIETRKFIKENRSDWSSIKHLDDVGGVYAVLLPIAWFSQPRVIHLHAPHNDEGPIPYEFTLLELIEGFGVVYVGRTRNLKRRLSFHLRNGKRKDGGQVKYGLFDCKLFENEIVALNKLRENARIIYTLLSGRENCANRDILEMWLFARYAPPFNIKSEH